MKLLLTGFEPFCGSEINPSEQVVKTLEKESLPGIELHTAILPVDRITGPKTLLKVIAEVQPDVVICLGEARGRVEITVERVAVNLMDYRIEDNAGNIIQDQPIEADGPAAYFCTIPVRKVMEAIKAAGVPAGLSLSAGAFLCNQVTYVLLHHLAENDIEIPAGFIHLPSLPEQVVEEKTPKPSMHLETMVKSIKSAISAIK
jgi:pyroglutamyl-peptidase